MENFRKASMVKHTWSKPIPQKAQVLELPIDIETNL